MGPSGPEVFCSSFALPGCNFFKKNTPFAAHPTKCAYCVYNLNFTAMQLSKTLLFLMISLGVVLFSSCNKEEEYTYEALSPVYMDFEEFRQAPKAKAPRAIKQSGKIYFKDNYIFINEPFEGIHVINNAFPGSPEKVAFYEILGNVDLAIRGNILFADSYIDLIALDISNLLNPVEVGRIENIFPEVLPMADEDLPWAWGEIDRSKGVIVGWKKKLITTTYSTGHWLWGWRGQHDLAMFANSESGAGVAGSMARFMLHQHYLYSIAQPWVLKTIDVSQPSMMVQTDSIHTWREMETLFRYQEHLFVGTTTGMVIYSLEDPSQPAFVSDLNHINACDPVVVENNIAYVTLRSGNWCMNTTNQLDVVDISDITHPVLLKSYPMFNPHGLGIDNNVLFICDGAAGLKVYDATNPLAIQTNMIAHFPGIDTYDVIPLGNVLLLIGQDGLFQYDYSDPTNIVLISHIQVGQ